MPTFSRLALWVVVSCLVVAANANEWPTDPSTNLPVAIDPNSNSTPKAVIDGQGGAIVAWEYWGPVANRRIFLQHVNYAGNLLWPGNGVPATSEGEGQAKVSIVSDGAGGAIVAWQDFRNGLDWDIYAQRVNADGNVMWAAEGVPLCTAMRDQTEVELAVDQHGGAVAVWRDMRVDGVASDVFAQRVSANGAALWTPDGEPVCTNAADQQRVRLTSPGEGVTIAVWDENRNAATTSQDIFAQRLLPNGVTAWLPDGIAVCSAANWQLDAQIVETMGGGAILAWYDDRTLASRSDVYAQRLDSLGAAVWSTDGIPVCAAEGNQTRPQLVRDGAGAAFVSWPDERDGSSIYASKVNPDGQMPWAVDGVPVCTGPGGSSWPKIVLDGTGGVIIAWEDGRNAPFPSFNYDVFAQRLDSSGSPMWTLNGIAVSTAPDMQSELTPVPDGSSGIIVAWTDLRDGGYMAQRYDVYAQRVNADGSLGGPTAVSPTPSAHGLRILEMTPNPFSLNARIEFQAENSGDVEILLYSVTGRLVFRDITRASRGDNRYLLHGLDANGTRLPSGVYFLRLQSGLAIADSKLVIAR
jgi:hypothetical protein